MILNEDKSVTFDYNETLVLIRDRYKKYYRAIKNKKWCENYLIRYPKEASNFYTIAKMEKYTKIIDENIKFYNLYELLYKHKRLKK